MEDHWGCPGSKREALIIKVGWDFRTIETPGHSCNSPAVRVCTNTSVSVFQINFCRPTTWLTEVCCVIDSNTLMLQLQSLHKTAKIILDLPIGSSAREALNNLKWKTLARRRAEQRATFIFKCLKTYFHIVSI